MNAVAPFRDEHLKLSNESFQRLSGFVTRELGIKMPPGKLTMLQGRLARRIRRLGLDDIDAYREYLFSSPAAETERLAFIDLVTTNKTEFFREIRHFEFLAKEGLSLLGGPHCRVWCAGCSSGEEAYSIAMVLAEHARLHEGFDFSVVATDISTRMLRKAVAGVYDEVLTGPISPVFRHQFLMRSRDRTRHLVRIVPELRAKLHFKRLNFMDEAYPFDRSFDLVFFRNVMIYFDADTQQKVLSRICEHLRPGGLLIVGHTESLIGLHLPIRQIESAVHLKEGP